MVENKSIEEMVRTNPEILNDDEFEEMIANQPKRSREECEREVEEFL